MTLLMVQLQLGTPVCVHSHDVVLQMEVSPKGPGTLQALKFLALATILESVHFQRTQVFIDFVAAGTDDGSKRSS